MSEWGLQKKVAPGLSKQVRLLEKRIAALDKHINALVKEREELRRHGWLYGVVSAHAAELHNLRCLMARGAGPHTQQQPSTAHDLELEISKLVRGTEPPAAAGGGDGAGCPPPPSAPPVGWDARAAHTATLTKGDLGADGVLRKVKEFSDKAGALLM